MRSPVLLLSLLILPPSASALDHEPTVASGYVTALDSTSSFSVEGASIRLEPNATYATDRAGTVTEDSVPQPIYLGEFLRISGRVDNKAQVVNQATIRKNLVRHAEDKLREKGEFDPAAVTPDQQQGRVSRSLIGLDPKRLPAADNPELAARIERIGQSLVPAYQRSLDPADPTRIHFRFQVVDLPKHPQVVTLPSGIVLVPVQLLDRLTNDSQIAALLSQGIADAIEKDDLRLRPTKYKARAASLTALAAAPFVPGVLIATELGSGRVEAHVLKLQREQRDRVSLCLLNDAGYDLSQAPMTFWLLAPEKPTSIDNIPLPAQAAHLYQLLGTSFRGHTAPIPSKPSAGPQSQAPAQDGSQLAAPAQTAQP